MFKLWINRIEVTSKLLRMLIKYLMDMTLTGIIRILATEKMKSIKEDILGILFKIRKKKKKKFIQKLLI